MEWWERLAAIRRAQRLSQKAFATLVPVSVSSLSKYETGNRHPSRPTIRRMLDILRVPRDLRDEVLVAAGYPPDGPSLGPGNQDYLFSRQAALEDLERRRWPAALLDEFMQVLGANRLLQRLWEVNLDRDLPDPVDRNLLSLISHSHFEKKLVNWSEAVSVGLATIKGHHRGAEDLATLSPYFASVFERFAEGVPERVTLLASLWESTEPRTPKIRWSFPVIWQLEGVRPMHFEVVVSTANDPGGLAFHDWVPLDAGTWEALETVRSRRQ